MGYRVLPVHKTKDGRVTSFRIVWETYKGKVRDQYKHILKTDYESHGFSRSLDFEGARAIAKTKNQDKNEKRLASIKNQHNEKKRTEDQQSHRLLPEPLTTEFEQSILKRFCDSDAESRKFHKFLSNWRAVKRLIRKADIDPSDYSEQPEVIYNLCAKLHFSPEYVKKIRRVLNLWGFFISRKQAKPFLPLPVASKQLSSKIEDRFFEKSESGFASDPLTPDQLRLAKAKLQESHYNWLYLSVWLGLRPQEIDNLHNAKNWKRTTEKVEPSRELIVLHVHQTKLTSIPKKQRWKLIPLVEPEQHECLRIIMGGEFKRPLIKTIEAHVGEGITTYGGRKNFTDLMLARNYSLETISAWLGHSSIELTWKKYRNRLAVSIKKVS